MLDLDADRSGSLGCHGRWEHWGLTGFLAAFGAVVCGEFCLIQLIGDEVVRRFILLVSSALLRRCSGVCSSVQRVSKGASTVDFWGY